MEGYETWIDEAEINPGDNISKSIETGMAKADYFAIFFSQKARESYWVERELRKP